MNRIFCARRLVKAGLAAGLIAAGMGFGIGPAADAQTAPEPFSFSADAQKARAQAEAEQQQQAQEIERLVSVPCQRRLKNRKILQLVAERSASGWQTTQERYGPFFQVIDRRLQALGLQTYTQEQIRQRIAQAEVEAYFNNDPDAALAASKRLGADYVLRGSISTTAAVNPVVQINEVAVTVDLTLADASGRVLSEVGSHSESYSGTDTLGTAFALVREQADRMVAQLYNDYCRKAAGS
jgi:hypothetical protein